MAIGIRYYSSGYGEYWCLLETSDEYLGTRRFYYLGGKRSSYKIRSRVQDRQKDSAWICKLLLAGLLKGSFVPDQSQRDLRDLTRYRRKLVQNLATEHNRLIRIFEDANLKLSSVFSDVTGKTCTAVIDQVIDGDTDPEFLASPCTHWRLKSTQEEIALAVEVRLGRIISSCIRLSVGAWNT